MQCNIKSPACDSYYMYFQYIALHGFFYELRVVIQSFQQFISFLSIYTLWMHNVSIICPGYTGCTTLVGYSIASLPGV